MIPTPPDAILLQLGPIAVRWYGLLYAVGLLVAYRFMVREAHRRKLNAELIATGLVIVSIAALARARRALPRSASSMSMRRAGSTRSVTRGRQCWRSRWPTRLARLCSRPARASGTTIAPVLSAIMPAPS